MTKDSLKEALEQNKDIPSLLAPDQIAKVEVFLKALITFNQHTNLVAKSETAILIDRHVVDSLTLVPIINHYSDIDKVQSLVDVGTGGGFPGTIVAIACENLEVSLLEATAKKCRFLETAAAQIKLKQPIGVINGRAEELGNLAEFRETFDFATVRAVGTVALVAELLIPLLKVGGFAFLQKTDRQLQEEMPEAEIRLEQLGATVEEVISLAAEGSDSGRVVLVLGKKSKTPADFPRPWSRIKRE